MSPLESGPEEFEIGNYVFRPQLRLLLLKGKVLRLSPKESELLTLLCQHLNKVLKREVALKCIWNENTYFTARSMDVYIVKLRRYLQDDAAVEIVNLHGHGYSLCIQNKIVF
jgi:two-component system, OmpR family, response regulator